MGGEYITLCSIAPCSNSSLKSPNSLRVYFLLKHASHMTSETARIEAFSDGVFAIAITLLVLELKVPLDGPLSVALRRQWPSYIAFLLSFTFIGIMWVNHHRLFTQIRRADDGLLFLNLLLLLGVTVVPFPTSVLARHLGTVEGRTAAAVFN